MIIIKRLTGTKPGSEYLAVFKPDETRAHGAFNNRIREFPHFSGTVFPFITAMH
jgi:hypothetical protein